MKGGISIWTVGTLELYDDTDAELDMSIGSHLFNLTLNKSPVRGTELNTSKISRQDRKNRFGIHTQQNQYSISSSELLYGW